MSKRSTDNPTELSLDELINLKLEESETKHIEAQLAAIETCNKPSKKKKSKHRKKKRDDSDSDSDYEHTTKQTRSFFKGMPVNLRDAFVLFVLFVVFSSRLATGQADRLFKIQTDQYSIYDLMARGIAVALLFLIICRLLAITP